MKVRIPQGAGGPSNMQSMLKQAQKMQEDMAAKQAELETLEDLITAAVNEAIKKVEAVSADEMQKITGSLGLPGMF